MYNYIHGINIQSVPNIDVACMYYHSTIIVYKWPQIKHASQFYLLAI